MTQEEAYIKGFCKTAEDLGYKHEALVKRAGGKVKTIFEMLKAPFVTYGNRITGKSLKPLEKAVSKDRRTLAMLARNKDPSAKALMKKMLPGLSRSERALQKELGKVNLTRGLTGGGAAGLLAGGLMSGGGDDAPSYPYAPYARRPLY